MQYKGEEAYSGGPRPYAHALLAIFQLGVHCRSPVRSPAAAAGADREIAGMLRGPGERRGSFTCAHAYGGWGCERSAAAAQLPVAISLMRLLVALCMCMCTHAHVHVEFATSTDGNGGGDTA